MAYVDAFLNNNHVYSFEKDKTYTVGFDFYGETVSDFNIDDIVLYDGKVITDDVGTFTAKTFGSNTYFEANFTAKQNLSFEPGQNGVGTLFRIRPANGEPGVGVVGAFDQDQDMDGIYDDNVDTVLRLFNSSGEEIAFSDDYGSDVYSRIDTVLKPGTYTIAISGYANDSYAATPADLTSKDGTPDGKVDGLDAYVATDRFSGDTGIAALSLIINPEFQADPNGILKSATELLISPGEAISLTEKFGYDNSVSGGTEIQVRNLRDIDIFRVDTPAEGKLLIDIESDASAPANTHLRFFDSRGVELANNSGGAATDSAGVTLETCSGLATGG